MNRTEPTQPAYYTDLAMDVAWTGDLKPRTATADLSPALDGERTLDMPNNHGFDVEELEDNRRGYERYHLADLALAATVYDEGPTGGRVTEASVTGMWVETQHPLPFRSSVRVEWAVPGGYVMTFQGRVVRAVQDGMAIHLVTDDATWRFRSSFIDLARTRTDSRPSVTVWKNVGTEVTGSAVDDAANRRLSRKWTQVESSYEADDVHQAFIHECLSAQRMQFALERYRERKIRNPDCALTTRYLQQIGTILTFSTLTRSAAPEKAESKRFLPIALMVAAVFGLVLAAHSLANHRLEAPGEPVPQAAQPQ